MLTNTTPATATDLTTLDVVKAQLNILSDDEDDILEAEIASTSAMICNYLEIASANDGSRTLGRETLVETIRRSQGGSRPRSGDGRAIMLARYPVVSITSVVEDGTALVATDFELDGAKGLLTRLADDIVSDWTAMKVVVTYVAGWLMPGQVNRNLPTDIEDVAIGLIGAGRFARLRDPLVKGEEIPGVLRTDYWVGSIGNGSMPPDLAAQLDPYRNVRV